MDTPTKLTQGHTATTTCPSDNVRHIKTGTCPKCGDPIGVSVIALGGLKYPMLCRCEREAQERVKRQEQQRDRANKIERLCRFYRDTVPREYCGATLDGYIIRNTLPEAERRSCENALAMSRRYVSEWEQNRKNGTGLIFIGNSGGGKTHLACAIGYAVTSMGYSARYACVVDLMREIRTAPLSCLEDVVDSYKRCPLLILDDLGTEKSSDWVDEQLYAVVNGRTTNYRPTIITTNLSGADWQRVQGKVIDRIQERSEKVLLKCESYRRAKKGTP